MAHRAVVYARISNDRTGLEAGVDRQQADAANLCERRSWDVVGTYVDNDLTASRYGRKPRPAYQQLIAQVAAGQVDAIAAFHTDRLYRQPKELEALIDLVEATGLLIATCEGDFDLGTADGRAMARVIVAMAAKESDDKSRRIRRNHQAIAAGGGYSGGKRPFGYERDGKTIRPAEADLIRDAARRILAGESSMAICRDWDDAGVATVMGGHWRSTTLNRMLLTPRLYGMRTHHGALTPAVWPAILDEPTHQRLKAVLSDPARNTVGGARARSYLLTGVLYCAGCTTRMAGHSGRYQCEKHMGGCNGCGINAARLEADVVPALLTAASSSKVRRRLSSRSAPDEAQLLEQIASTEAEIELFAADLREGRVGRAGYLAAVGALEQRLEAHRATLTLRLAAAPVVALVEDPTAGWDGLSFDRQRAAVAALIERIDVRPSTRQQAFYDFTRAEVTWR